MIKFKAKTKDCYLIVNAKLTPSTAIDTKELDFFSRKYFRGFLKPKMIKKNQIEYTGPIGISLYERLKKPISKYDFFLIIEQILVAVQKIWSNNLFLSKLVLSIQNIYINEVTKEVQLIYVPLAMTPANPNMIVFLESIIYSTIPVQESDTDYVSRFLHFLHGLNRFEIDAIEKYIASEDRSVVNTIRKNNASQSGFMTNKQQHYYDHYAQTKNSSSDGAEPTGLLAEDDATGLLMEDDDATRLLSDDNEATGLLLSDDEEATGLLTENNANVHFPTLFRVLTKETISVNKPVFRLGKEKSYVDYFVTNNIAVSRSHADIIIRGNRYFVIDLNSKNHTYINNQKLPVHSEVELCDGDSLRLGNEEFIFNA